MPDTFADTLRQHILAAPEHTHRAHRILAILDSPDSPRRSQHIATWEAAVREHFDLGTDTTIDWATVLQWLQIIGTVISIILMLLPFLAPEPAPVEVKAVGAAHGH